MPRKRSSKHIKTRWTQKIPRHFLSKTFQSSLSIRWVGRPNTPGMTSVLLGQLRTPGNMAFRAQYVQQEKLGKNDEKDHRKNGRNISLKAWQVTFHPAIQWFHGVSMIFPGIPRRKIHDGSNIHEYTRTLVTAPSDTSTQGCCRHKRPSGATGFGKTWENHWSSEAVAKYGQKDTIE